MLQTGHTKNVRLDLVSVQMSSIPPLRNYPECYRRSKCLLRSSWLSPASDGGFSARPPREYVSRGSKVTDLRLECLLGCGVENEFEGGRYLRSLLIEPLDGALWFVLVGPGAVAGLCCVK